MSDYLHLPEVLYFQDDGYVPNSRYPLIVYRSAFAQRGTEGAEWLEEKFAQNGWTNSWRNGIYPYHHFHSNSHEVTGVYDGSAVLQLGGDAGRKLLVEAGDILVIPAGVGHRCLEHTGLAVVGAYAGGRHWDLMKGGPGERPAADRNIVSVPLPAKDPLCGTSGGICKFWRKE